MSAPTPPPPTCDNCYREVAPCMAPVCNRSHLVHVEQPGLKRTHFCQSDGERPNSERMHAQTGGYRGRHRYEILDHATNMLCHRIIRGTRRGMPNDWHFYARMPSCDCGNEADTSWCDDNCARRSYLALAHADKQSR